MASLYLHIPFCERKCLYCDFYSVENLESMEAFLRAIDREIAGHKELGAGTTFDTVFFGGGTPSLLAPLQLERLLQRLHETFKIDPGAELTIETNPGTVNVEKLIAYRALGINRLSIGIQSLRDSELRWLGRIHDARSAISCMEFARRAGFDNVGIDLIYSLPGQTSGQWDETLKKSLDLEPDHVSAYSLIVEDNTPLAALVASRQVSPNPAEIEAALYEQTMDSLRRHGFEHYEVSNYARPGRRSRHNYAYWTHTCYLGFGPSAHAFWMHGTWETATRWSNIAGVGEYSRRLENNQAPVVFRESLTAHQLFNERMFLGLRSDGVDLKRLHRDFPLRQERGMLDIARGLVCEGSAAWEGDRLRLTDRGYLLCDEIATRMMI